MVQVNLKKGEVVIHASCWFFFKTNLQFKGVIVTSVLKFHILFCISSCTCKINHLASVPSSQTFQCNPSPCYLYHSVLFSPDCLFPIPKSDLCLSADTNLTSTVSPTWPYRHASYPPQDRSICRSRFNMASKLKPEREASRTGCSYFETMRHRKVSSSLSPHSSFP